MRHRTWTLIYIGVFLYILFILVEVFYPIKRINLNSRPHLNYAIALQRAGNHQEAAEEYKMSLSLNHWNHPDSATATRNSMSKCYLNLGVIYLMEENLEDALCCFYQAGEIHPPIIPIARHNMYVSLKRAGRKVLLTENCIIPKINMEELNES